MLTKLLSMPKSMLPMGMLITFAITFTWGIASIYQKPLVLNPQKVSIGWIFLIFSLWTLSMIVYDSIQALKSKKEKIKNAK